MNSQFPRTDSRIVDEYSPSVSFSNVSRKYEYAIQKVPNEGINANSAFKKYFMHEPSAIVRSEDKNKE